MKNLSFQNYFDNEYKYYDPKILLIILEDILGKNICDLKKEVEEMKINVKERDIKEYLNKMFEKENRDVKERLKDVKPKNGLKRSKNTKKEISQRSADIIMAERYHYEPFTLEYFNKYTSIVKNKSIELLNIIEKLANKDIECIQDYLTDLDIVLDENQNISRIDIIRLIKPTIYNIEQLNEKISKANDLSTYLTFKISKHSLSRNGIYESEIYPIKKLQVKNIYPNDFDKSCVSLSKKQVKNDKKNQEKVLKMFMKMLTN